MESGPAYREWRPAASLRRHVACTWAGRLGPDGASYVERVLPDGCIDVVWDGRGLFVAGPDTGPVPIPHRPGGFFAGLRFRPGLAPAGLGVPASALRDLRVQACEVLGPEVEMLHERLHRAESLRAATVELERWLADRLRHAPPPDPLAEAVTVALGTSSPAPSLRVASLARELGVGERRLHRHCTAAVGYGPKTLHRILRFRRFLAAAESPDGPGLARLAMEAGYADQAHLTRECRRLAGTSPAALLSSWRTTGASG